jgi:ribosome maturation factor RimP
MDSILAKIKESIEAPLKEMDIFVDSVTWELENNYYYLKIVLDKVNGIDLDTIVEATNIINPILDDLDLIQDEYILDVSSKERGE